MTPERMCSKCGVFVAAAKHAWCIECKAESQESNRKAKIRQAKVAGFADGCDAMTDVLQREFQRLGGAVVTCFEVASAIRATRARPTLDAWEAHKPPAIADSQHAHRFPVNGAGDRTAAASRTIGPTKP